MISNLRLLTAKPLIHIQWLNHLIYLYVAFKTGQFTILPSSIQIPSGMAFKFCHIPKYMYRWNVNTIFLPLLQDRNLCHIRIDHLLLLRQKCVYFI